MSARQSYAVTLALESVRAGASISAAARAHGCDLRSLRRALRRHEALAALGGAKPSLTAADGGSDDGATLPPAAV